jgi:hypothetical protein
MPDRRIRVSTTTRALIRDEEREVVVVGVSPRSALFVTTEEAGLTGSTLTLYLPGVDREIELLAGIERVEKVADGFAVVVAFILVEQTIRRALNDLMALLLAGTGGGARVHPRIVYDAVVKYGPALSRVGRLQEVSSSGACVRIADRLPPDATMQLSIPEFSTNEHIEIAARVVNQRISHEGGYLTGVEFIGVSGLLRARLARLLADLLCR